MRTTVLVLIFPRAGIEPREILKTVVREFAVFQFGQLRDRLSPDTFSCKAVAFPSPTASSNSLVASILSLARAYMRWLSAVIMLNAHIAARDGTGKTYLALGVGESDSFW